MATILVIKAHQDVDIEQSKSITILNTFLDKYKQLHPEDKVIERNVSEEMPFPFNKISLSIYNKRLHHQNLTEEEDHFAKERFVWVKEFVDADKYVFANPMYNLFLPAELKSYIDIVMQVPYTFHYTKEGVAEGLLRDKKALHIQANGGTYHKF